MRSHHLLLALALLVCPPCQSEEYFGEYKDALVGAFVDAKPRPRFRLANEFRFSDPNGLLWSVPSEKEVDGASIPQAFWSLIGGPFAGDYIKASVVHDHYCDVKTRTDHDTHRNFYYGMRTAGVVEWKAKLMYWAVNTFGPAWTLERQVIQELTCKVTSGTLACTQVPVMRVGASFVPAVDLSDPDTLAAALSKTAAVARSLKTTGGRVLDVSLSGEVEADLESISSNASQYRALFINRTFLQTPKLLGILSQWDGAGVEEVRPWENDTLPKLGEALTLGPTTVESIESGSSFKVDLGSAELLRDRMDFKAIEMRYESGGSSNDGGSQR